jgi:hypothetical protein
MLRSSDLLSSGLKSVSGLESWQKPERDTLADFFIESLAAGLDEIGRSLEQPTVTAAAV